MKQLSPKHKPKISKSLASPTQGAYRWDLGNVAFDNPGKRGKNDDYDGKSASHREEGIRDT